MKVPETLRVLTISPKDLDRMLALAREVKRYNDVCDNDRDAHNLADLVLAIAGYVP